MLNTALNIDCCFFVLENVRSNNKRRNDIKRIKILVDKNNNLLSTPFDRESDIKKSIRNKIKSVIGSGVFHLEQVHALGEKKYYNSGIHVIYLGITNEENIKEMDSHYKMVDFDIIHKKEIHFDNKIIKYATKMVKINNSLEYYHTIKTNNLDTERKLIELLTSYKQIVSKIDYTDIIFKFLPKYYTLEDVRIIYEKIKNISVDKSNFRKKIMKYCKKTDTVIKNKGHRPTHLYEFLLNKKDVWI